MDSLLISQDSFEKPQIFDESVLYFTKRCIHKDTPNEDSLSIVKLYDNSYVFAVADGAGGHPKGEEASRVCLEKIIEALKGTEKKESYRYEILNGVESANQQLIASGIGCRTTVSIIEYIDGRARTYQVGDSTSLICGQKGKLKFRSTSHSPVGYGVVAGLIAEKEALEHPDLNVISNFVGENEMKIEIGPTTEINKNDSLLLASDGLFDNFETDAIIEIIRKGSVEQVSEAMMDALDSKIYQNKDAKQDDLTFILFQPKH